MCVSCALQSRFPEKTRLLKPAAALSCFIAEAVTATCPQQDLPAELRQQGEEHFKASGAAGGSRARVRTAHLTQDSALPCRTASAHCPTVASSSFPQEARSHSQTPVSHPGPMYAPHCWEPVLLWVRPCPEQKPGRGIAPCFSEGKYKCNAPHSYRRQAQRCVPGDPGPGESRPQESLCCRAAAGRQGAGGRACAHAWRSRGRCLR